MCYRQYLDILYPKHEIKLKVGGYMKNGGKKNKTDSKLDCYHNRVKPVLTLQYVSVGSSNNVCVENILFEDQNSQTTH